jgi:predicted N-acetyltransferase YhbS
MEQHVNTAIAVENAEQRAIFCAGHSLPRLDPEALDQSGADAHVMVEIRDTAAARCSLWWTATPSVPGQNLGLIGHYAAADAEAAARLLAYACARLAAQGCTLVVGPMDGSTHRRYRLLTERGVEPLFLLEPDNPDTWSAHFTENGFSALAHYSSALQPNLNWDDPRVPDVERRLAARGVRIRALALDHIEDELRRIYRVVTEAFRAGYLYTPIAEEDFLEQYRPLVPVITPELVLLAEHDDRPVGFLFVIPDWLQAQRGQPIDTLILKTVAVLPSFAGHGLVGLLIARGLEAARELGYSRVIHALMLERNASVRLSDRYGGRVIRRYTLFARSLRNQP